jgi:hypothetical protein
LEGLGLVCKGGAVLLKHVLEKCMGQVMGSREPVIMTVATKELLARENLVCGTDCDAVMEDGEQAVFLWLCEGFINVPCMA